MVEIYYQNGDVSRVDNYTITLDELPDLTLEIIDGIKLKNAVIHL